jgi:hypothetical protein
LKNGASTVRGTNDLLAHATDFYRNLFGSREGGAFEFDTDLWQDQEKVSALENEELIKHFTKEEIKSALFSMEKNKATGPDGLPVEFYQHCWEIIKVDMVPLFQDFYLGVLDIKRINYEIITLLPKVKEDERIQRLRPICLLNCLYKWFTKCLTIRLEPVAARIIHKSQTTFIKGRNIMNNVLALHEILHETKLKRKIGVVLKLNFEKAYDKVNWNFLLQCLNKSGFSETWCEWIRMVLHNGIVSVKQNNEIRPYFTSHKGVRQGDPLSPLLFNIAADVLTRMVISAQQNSLITGMIYYLIPRG